MPDAQAGPPSTGRSDEELWERFVGGDAAALAELRARHTGPLYRYLLLSTGRPDEAGRHVVGTWSLLACYRERFQGFASFRAWLYAVATQRWMPPTHPEQFGLTDLMDDLRRGRPSSREGRIFFRVNDMHRSVRQPFLLEALAGLGPDEIAAACRFTPERVRKALATAYRRLARSGLFGPGEGADAESRAAIAEQVRQAADVSLPEEMAELVERGVAEATESGEVLRTAPADWRPERSGRQRAALVVASIVLFVVGSAGLLALLGGRGEPVPPVAEAASLSGRAEVRPPGVSVWREMGRRESLPPGAQVRTGPQAYLVLRGEGVEWWLPPVTVVALPEPRTAELLAGRLYARVETGEAPGRVTSENGSVACPEGEFVARVTSRRFIAGCVGGDAAVEAGEASAQLGPGELTMATRGEHVGPVRPVRPAQLTHWLGEFARYEGRHIEPRQLAGVPLAPAAPALPRGVRMERLALELTVRGPLALVEVRAALSNEGDAQWQGTLDLGAAVLPPPLAITSDGPLRLAPGEGGEARLAGLCLMRDRRGHYALGIDPGAWSGGTIGRLDVQVSSDAQGGIGRFACPTLGARLRPRGALDWTARRRDFAAETPLVFEFEFGKPEGIACLTGSTDGARAALVAWRPPAVKQEWIAKERNVFIAFDATADFGPGGRFAAQEALEGLIQALPPGCSTALLAYDGRLRLDPDRLALHHPDRVESMLSGLWQLQVEGAEEEAAPGAFLAAAVELAVGAEGEGLLVFVTGREAPVELPEARPDGGLRVCVIQVGAEAPAAAYAALCAGTGGVALAVPPTAAPDLAVIDFLVNLDVAALREVALDAPGAGAAAVLRGEARFSSQPVVGLLALPGAGGSVAGRFRARAGGRALERHFALEATPVDSLPPALVRVLGQRHLR